MKLGKPTCCRPVGDSYQASIISENEPWRWRILKDVRVEKIIKLETISIHSSIHASTQHHVACT